MKVGVVSDTHIPQAARRLPADLLRGLEGVDMILHAGDLVAMKVVETLGRIAPTCAVYGNMDRHEVRAALPRKRIVSAGKWRIGLIHGHGGPARFADRMEAQFGKMGENNVDVVVFGHTHSSCEDWRGEVLRFNPGSPTDQRFTPYRSYGILTFGENIECEIVHLD